MELLIAVALAVGLFVLARVWIWRLDIRPGPGNLAAFIPCGLLYTIVYGCALGWVLVQGQVLGVFAAFFSFPLVFGGVRQLAGYFGFNPVYYVASGSALAALGLFFSLVAIDPFGYSGKAWFVPLFFMGAFVILAILGRDWDKSAPKNRSPRGEMDGFD